MDAINFDAELRRAGADATKGWRRLGFVALHHALGTAGLVIMAVFVLAAALAEATGEAVADYDVLIDIPKPEKWTTDVWVHFTRPPVGFESLMHWQDVVGLGDDDFKRYEEHRRLIRIVTAPRLRDAARRHWDDLLLPAIVRRTGADKRELALGDVTGGDGVRAG